MSIRNYQNILAGRDEESKTDLLTDINDISVDHLDVSYNALGTSGIIKLKDAIFHATKLNLHNTGLSDESIKHLIINPNIVELNLSRNLLMDSGANLLADILKPCKNLTKLEISSCRITAKGIKNLCEVLLDKPITYLDISDNGVEVETIYELLTIETLTYFDLSDTDISNTEVDQIVEVSKHSRIRELKFKFTLDDGE